MYLDDNDKDIDYNDTTMINYARSSAYGIEWVSFLSKYNEQRCLSFYYTIEEMTPYDTMRVFVYEDKYRCIDTIKYGFRVPFEIDEYLVRYDISTDDAYELMNGNGEIEVCYPPDERMKDIKMWPKFTNFVGDAQRDSNSGQECRQSFLSE